MTTTLLSPKGSNGIYGIEANDLRWIDAARPGLRLAPVMEDRERGKFLGLLEFERLASTGLHQHRDIAFSYFLDGGLADYQGSATIGDMGINLPGATHDAIAYRRTLAAARLEGPVIYEGPGKTDAPTLHSGAKVAPIVNEHPEVMPDINIPVERIAPVSTSVAGVTRKLIYDYYGVERDGRSVQLQFLPGSVTPPMTVSAPLSIFVIGGALSVGDVTITGGGFCIVEAASHFQIKSKFGALVIAWAEAPTAWHDRSAPDLFGF
jgi:hypothetical protein